MSWWDRHVLPRLVDCCCGLAEIDKLREPVCSGLAGDVLEIGFGSGLNVAHYPPAVRRVTAVEPSDVAWRMAAPRVAKARAEVVRGGLDGQHLDLPAASYDHALSTFTMCTIPDLDLALAEVRRVLRPGGRLHFVEHGLAPDERVARWQHRLTPLQRRLAGGCHLDRPILEAVELAGFAVEKVDRFYGKGPKAAAYFYLGSATAPA
jgi:SAM-dependent methyltransferase